MLIDVPVQHSAGVPGVSLRNRPALEPCSRRGVGTEHGERHHAQRPRQEDLCVPMTAHPGRGWLIPHGRRRPYRRPPGSPRTGDPRMDGAGDYMDDLSHRDRRTPLHPADRLALRLLGPLDAHPRDILKDRPLDRDRALRGRDGGFAPPGDQEPPRTGELGDLAHRAPPVPRRGHHHHRDGGGGRFGRHPRPSRGASRSGRSSSCWSRSPSSSSAGTGAWN